MAASVARASRVFSIGITLSVNYGARLARLAVLPKDSRSAEETCLAWVWVRLQNAYRLTFAR